MRDASVGFHCPECVKEGARSTRQAKAAYGGRRITSGATVTFTLIGLNVLVFLLILAAGGSNGSLVEQLVLRPAQVVPQYPGVSGGAYWQLLTSMFAHVQLLHIGLNMLSLYFLGPMLEQALGRARFLAVYLVSGLIGSAAIMLFSQPLAATLGASGAIFGLMGALLVLVFKRGLDPRQILFWVGLNLVFTFYSGINISWQAHVGGLLGGMLVTAVIVYAPKKNREAIQWTGVALVAVLAVVVSVIRAASFG